MIHIHLPDGATRALDPDSTAADLAASISPSLAKRAVAAVVDGRASDLKAPLPDGATVELMPRNDPRALELIRQNLAQVLAEAVQALWPGTKTAIGPAIEHGFYYDFERDTPFTPEDLPVIEKKMREIIASNTPSSGKYGPGKRRVSILRQAEERTVTIRRHRTDKTQTLPLDEAVQALVAEAQSPRERN